jgi:hypothetical protein
MAESRGQAREAAQEELQRVRQLAALAHELRCEITAGPYTVRPIVEPSPGERVRAVCAALKGPIVSFFEKF